MIRSGVTDASTRPSAEQLIALFSRASYAVKRRCEKSAAFQTGHVGSVGRSASNQRGWGGYQDLVRADRPTREGYGAVVTAMGRWEDVAEAQHRDLISQV